MLLGLCGPARCGKDSVANIILKAAPELVKTKYSFAMPLKRIINTFFGWEVDNMDLPFKEDAVKVPVLYWTEAIELYKQYGLHNYLDPYKALNSLVIETMLAIEPEWYRAISPRKAYQIFGTDIMRAVNKDIWIEIAPIKNIILTDVRFINEAEWLKENNGILVYINRDIRIKDSNHPSELEMDKIKEMSLIDYQIYNTGTIEDLEVEVNNLITAIKR